MEKVTVMLATIAMFLACKVLEDFGFIEKESKLWHWAAAAGRTVIIGYACWTVWGVTLPGILVTTDITVAWWIGFDIALNLKRGNTPFYVGSGTIDLTVKAVAKLAGINWEILMFLLKLAALIIMTITTVLLWSR